MNFGLDLNLNVGLEQKLSPQMIQSLKLLQMNSMELETVVKQELESNPMLEAADDVEDQEAPKEEEDSTNSDFSDENQAAKAEDNVVSENERIQASEETAVPDAAGPELDKVIPDDAPATKEIDWESYLEEGFDLGSKRTEELESPDERFEKVPVYSKTLQDHLLTQLQDRSVSARVAELVEYLVNSLDDRGYLVIDAKQDPVDEDEEEAEEAVEDDMIGHSPRNGGAAAKAKAKPEPVKPPVESDPAFKEIQGVIEGTLSLEEASRDVREAFHVLHGMEPAGVGARNLRECLLLQMHRTDRISPLARRIVEEEFDLLEKLKVAAIGKKFDVPPDQVQTAMREIGQLQPHPGRLISATVSNPITPDLIVEEVEGELVLMLNDRTVPSLKVSRAYSEMLKKGSRASTEEKKFVREKLNSATWLIRAIEQRKSTMLKVMQAIIESQPEFFKQGPTHLRPLILQDVADKIGMHISTVSRVTNGKYVQTSHGIFELKYFFTAGVTQADGREVSSVTTKDEIKKLIESEDTKRPLSDQKIVEILKSKGLDVARRTVAKYRDQLEILPARLRKQY
jgi:RNA polymerase sigma-54 factor